MAQSAEPQHGYLLARSDVPLGDRRIGGDAGAQQRSCRHEVQGIGNTANKPLIDDDFLRVAALSDSSVDIPGVVSTDRPVEARLLLPCLALLTVSARVDQTSDAYSVSRFVLRDLGTNSLNDSGNLMTDGQREVRLAPLVANGVNVRMTDSSSFNVDDDVVGTRVSSFNLDNFERPVRSILLKRLDDDGHE